MYTLMRNTITMSGQKLSELKHKITKLYAMGELSEAQADELLGLAYEKADPESERPEALSLILTLADKVEALTARVKVLEGGNIVSGTDEGDTDEYPAWEPWDGLSDKYQPGVVVCHNDRLWESAYSGQNVWEPGVVDQRFWIQYIPED